MKDKIDTEIYLEYERLKRKSEREYRERLEDIYRRFPEIKELDMQISAHGFKTAAAVASGDPNAENMQKKLEELNRIRREMIGARGLSQYDFMRHYACEDCKDTGYLKNGERCHCHIRRLTQNACEESSISRLLKTQNFDSFDINKFSDKIIREEGKSPRDNMMEIRVISERFIENFDDENGQNLLFYGGTGQGKTFLSSCIAKALIDKRKSVVYETAPDLVQIMESASFSKEKSHDGAKRMELVRNADLLIIDDLGTEIANTFTVSQLFSLINNRIISGKKTIISTNLDLARIGKLYSERVYSRLLSSYGLIRFIGPDIRYSQK